MPHFPFPRCPVSVGMNRHQYNRRKAVTQLQRVLRNARSEKDLTYSDVEVLSRGGITAPYVGLIETKNHIPSPDKLKVLARIYKMDFLDLMVLAGHVERSDLKATAK